MSELKWNWVYYPYLDAPNKQEESALKAGYIKVVIKDEADKVIAEKDKELRRHKYKRCLAMAEWCNSEMGRETFACFRPRHTKEVWREKHKYWAKWRKIWFELYKKFKEGK